MRQMAIALFCFSMTGCFERFAGRDEEAIEIYRSAHEQKAQGAYLQAIQLYEDVLHIRPRVVEAYLHLSECYRHLGDSSAEQAMLERGVRVCGKNVVVALPLARLYRSRGQADKARDLYQALVEKHPELKEEMAALPSH